MAVEIERPLRGALPTPEPIVEPVGESPEHDGVNLSVPPSDLAR